MTVTVAEIEAAAERLRGVVRDTPVLAAPEISRRAGGTVTLKAECLQATGSFKVRGAFNAIARLTPDALEAGVVAASAGNHAHAVAAAASRAGARADLFMPRDATLAKVEAVRHHGGEVHLAGDSFDEAEALAARFATERGSTVVPPFDSADVIAGQGTIGLEIAAQTPDTRLIVVPYGGGALCAGIAFAAKERLPGVRVVAVRAEHGTSICDGIAVKRAGELTAPLIEELADEVVTVSDDEVAEAMVLLLERSKLVVEGAGAAGVAALIGGRVQPPPGGGTCAVLSGGNVDAGRLTECIALGETAAGRRIVLLVVLPDRPGSLTRLLEVVAGRGANVVDVEHVREGLDLHVGQTAVTLVLQTKGPDDSEALREAIAAAGFTLRGSLT